MTERHRKETIAAAVAEIQTYRDLDHLCTIFNEAILRRRQEMSGTGGLPTEFGSKAVEKLRQRQDILGDMRRIVEGVGADDRHVILLDDYEATNLRDALYACGWGISDPTGRSPLDVMNTGDWLGQVVMKIPYVGDRIKPNVDIFDLRQRARDWKP